MSFSNSATDLSKIIALTTFLGSADSIFREQTVAQDSYEFEDVKVATTDVLPGSPTYNNGSDGVGAYLQATSYLSGSGVLSIDTVVTEPGFRVLVKNQSSSAQNGVYKVYTEGGPSTYYKLIRVEDFDESSEIVNYSKFKVTTGSLNQDKTYFLESGGTPTVGTTALVFSQYPTAATSEFYITEFRKQFDFLKSEAEFDNAAAVINTSRNTELGLPTTINNLFAGVCSSLNTFYSAQYGSSFKAYFANAYNTGVYDTDNLSPVEVWTEDFRILWRNTMNEELVVRLGYVQKASSSTGSWSAFTADKTISLNTNMVVKIKQDLEEADVPVLSEEMPVTITLLDSDENAYVSTVNIPVGSLAEASFSITTTSRTTFATIQDVTISNLYGGTGQPIVEFWVAS
jgi:hypothetical protein